MSDISLPIDVVMKRRAVCHPKRVLHVLSSASLGGCESLCFDIATHMRNERWASEIVFLTDLDGPIRQRFLDRGLPVHNCVYKSRSKLNFINHFAGLCRERQADAVVCYSFGLLYFLTALAAWLGNIRHMVVHMGNPPPTERVQRWKATMLVHLARPFTTVVAACSDYVRTKAHQHYHLPLASIRQVWNACDVSNIHERAARARDVTKRGGPVIGIVSRLDPIKDHALVLRSFAHLVSKCPSAKLILVGDGPLRSALECLATTLKIRESVEFRGSRTDVPEQLAEFDIFVYATTKDEGFGSVLPEAMAAGIPIVCTDVGPCREVLANGDAGILTRPGDVLGLAEAMLCLWNDARVRNALSLRGPEIALHRYDVAHIARKYESLLSV